MYGHVHGHVYGQTYERIRSNGVLVLLVITWPPMSASSVSTYLYHAHACVHAHPHAAACAVDDNATQHRLCCYGVSHHIVSGSTSCSDELESYLYWALCYDQHHDMIVIIANTVGHCNTPRLSGQQRVEIMPNHLSHNMVLPMYYCEEV